MINLFKNFNLAFVLFAALISGCGNFNIISSGASTPAPSTGTDEEEETPEWRHPQSLSDHISPSGQDAYYPDTAMDESGNVIVVWMQNDGTTDQIFKSEFRNGTWTHPSSLTDNISPDGQSAWYPRVAMDNNGNAIIVWRQSDGTNSQIFKSEYRNGTWTHPSSLTDNISLDGKDAYDPYVAMSDNGDAVIAWEQPDAGINYQVFKSEYRSGSWTHPSGLADNISPDTKSAGDAQVAIDQNGNTIIVWEQDDAGNFGQIFKSEYRSGSWTHPSGLADNISPDNRNAGNPQVSIASNGDAIIVWNQDDASNFFQTFKSEYRSGSWTHPSGLADNISPDGTNAFGQSAAMDDNGNAIITWAQNNASGDLQAFKSEYRGGSWTHPASLSDHFSPAGSGIVYYPYVTMNKAGTKAIIVWDQTDTTYDKIYFSEYKNSAWTHPTATATDAISPDGSGGYIDHSFPSVNNDGQVIMVWWQGDGTDDQIFMSEYR